MGVIKSKLKFVAAALLISSDFIGFCWISIKILWNSLVSSCSWETRLDWAPNSSKNLDNRTGKCEECLDSPPFSGQTSASCVLIACSGLLAWARCAGLWISERGCSELVMDVSIGMPHSAQPGLHQLRQLAIEELFKLISNSDRLEQHKQKLRGKSMRIFRACESFHRYIWY